MAPRALKLGTRRSALARAQSGAIARQLERLHPGLSVQLVGIDTRGDRVIDRPLSAIEGKEFFTAEIDAALLRGEIDLTVHSYKDLSLTRGAQLRLAAVPRREQPHDVVLFAGDVPARLSAGHGLTIGSSSPRRASFVPDFLAQVLPARAVARPHVRLVPLRGNVDSRLRRLHEPRGSEHHLDGVVLAFAGIARLWSDEAFRPVLGSLLTGLPRMVLPLCACPSAPAQGALAIECRSADHEASALLEPLDDAATRRAVQAERALLAERGGGCQQRFGAALRELPGLGSLLYSREAREHAGAVELQSTQLAWTPQVPLPPIEPPVRPWDGSRAAPLPTVPDEAGLALAAERLPSLKALFIAHRRALPSDDRVQINPATHVWVPGVDSWRALAQRGIWVEGCAEGLGMSSIAALLAEPWLQLPAPSAWGILTHRGAAGGWPAGTIIATYAHAGAAPPSVAMQGPPADATHVYWASSAQFERWRDRVTGHVQHACGPGKTYEHLREAEVQNLHMFPHAQQWREWLQL